MIDYEIVRLTQDNFNNHSLDNFVLEQVVEECYRKINGEYVLTPVNYTADWSLQDKRKIADKIATAINNGSVCLGVLFNKQIIGFALVVNSLFGSNNQYIDLAEFYISKPFRRCGIGENLFNEACVVARQIGGRKLYISAHSAKESIAAYKKYGCVFAKEPDISHITKEPYDLQLEFDLNVLIYKVNDKQKYLDLLLLADEQEEMVKKYLDSVTMYVLDDNGINGEICVKEQANNILEIKNLAVYQEFQSQGYGSKLIEFVCNRYKDKFDIVEVGTGDSPLTLPFYQKCGFSKSRVIKDFFINNYDHPIYEDGVLLKDMIILSKKLT